MSKSLIKANRVNIGQDDARVIDSNKAVFERIQFLNEILENSYSDNDYFADEFTEGLDAEQVSALLDDPENASAVSVSEEDIENLLEEASAKAQEIVATANDEAAQILEEARIKAEEIKAAAYDEGHREGSEAGYNEGLLRTSQIEAELNEKIRATEAEYEAKVAQLEPRFVELLTDIYSHVFKVDLSDKTELVLYLLKDAIRNIDGGKSFFVHVSRDDYEYVAQHKEELMSGLASSCIVEIIEDITLSKSACFIEAESGIFDCGLGTELELLRKELNVLSYSTGEN